MKPRTLLTLLVAAASLVAARSQAQLVITLNAGPAQVVTGQGVQYTYTATLQNLFPHDLYFNSDFSTLDSPLTLDDSSFYNTFVFPSDTNGDPLPQPVLGPNGGTTTSDIFNVLVPDGTPDGTYNGLFLFLGGFTADDQSPLREAQFSLTVAGQVIAPGPIDYGPPLNPAGPPGTVPEPGALACLAALGAGAGALRLRRRV